MLTSHLKEWVKRGPTSFAQLKKRNKELGREATRKKRKKEEKSKIRRKKGKENREGWRVRQPSLHFFSLSFYFFFLTLFFSFRCILEPRKKTIERGKGSSRWLDYGVLCGCLVGFDEKRNGFTILLNLYIYFNECSMTYCLHVSVKVVKGFYDRQMEKKKVWSCSLCVIFGWFLCLVNVLWCKRWAEDDMNHGQWPKELKMEQYRPQFG